MWFLINAVGLQVILTYMMRHGMLHSAEHAAPKGTIEKQKVVKLEETDFGALGFTWPMKRLTCSSVFIDFSWFSSPLGLI